MVILGIDAGFSAPGLAVVDCPGINDGYGDVLWTECVRPAPADKKELRRQGLSLTHGHAWRIVKIVDRLAEAVAHYRPRVAAVELPTGGARSASAIRGMAFSTSMTVATLHTLKVPIYHVTPLKSKRGSTASEKAADKDMVVDAVASCWPIDWPMLKTASRPDKISCWAIADALSAALTFIRAERGKVLWTMLDEAGTDQALVNNVKAS